MSDCSICCEKFNRSNHKEVTCSFCDYVSCRSCIQQYLLSTSNDPHCMNCKNVWNREFIDSSCTKTFRNKQLKEHRENVLLNREKSLLPGTQHLVARKKRMNALNKLISEAEEELRRQKSNLLDLKYERDRLLRGGEVGEPEEKKTFVRKCPIENCKGFLSTRWKCDICENHVCPECNEKKEEGHECDPNAVETVKLLKKDSKPCPKCGEIHFRISGCSQMWCPSCHTAYNWNTGRIEHGVIHNPHYYEFQRSNGAARHGRNLGDIPCGGFPAVYEMRDRIDPRVHRTIYTIHNFISHVENYELRWTYGNVPDRPDNTDLRVKYLMDEISEDSLKKNIQKREKALEKKRDISNILRMFSDTGGDLMRQIVQEPKKLKEIEAIFENLKKYTNDVFDKIGHRYNNSTLYISKGWNLKNKSNRKVKDGES